MIYRFKWEFSIVYVSWYSYACQWKGGAAGSASKFNLSAAQSCGNVLHVFPSSDTEGESGSGMSMEQINGKQLTIRRPVDGTHHLLKHMCLKIGYPRIP